MKSFVSGLIFTLALSSQHRETKSINTRKVKLRGMYISGLSCSYAFAYENIWESACVIDRRRERMGGNIEGELASVRRGEYPGESTLDLGRRRKRMNKI